MLVSIELLDLVGYFEVNAFTSLSNQCAINCSLSMGFASQNVTQCQLDPLPNKLIWNEQAINLYIQNSNSIESKNKFDVFLQSNFTDSDKAVEPFNSIVYENTLQSAKLVKKLFRC
jgi:hypothetical protein